MISYFSTKLYYNGCLYPQYLHFVAVNLKTLFNDYKWNVPTLFNIKKQNICTYIYIIKKYIYIFQSNGFIQ